MRSKYWGKKAGSRREGGEKRRVGPSLSTEGDVFRNGQGPERVFNWRTMYKLFCCSTRLSVKCETIPVAWPGHIFSSQN